MAVKVPHCRQADGSSDRRWVILTDGGMLGTVSRARDPSDDELASVEASLISRGLGGWLAIQSHSLNTEAFPEFLEVRAIGNPKTAFADAVAAVLSTHASLVAHSARK